MRVALAQVDSVLGDVDANLRASAELVRRARAEGADLIVFPELALTGYSIGEVEEDLSLRATDPRLAGVATAARGIDCVLGFQEAGRLHDYNSVAYFERGELRHVHRKLYLPTYGVWEERKHFTPGDALRAFDTRLAQLGMLICGDAWQPAVASLVVQDGARVLLVPSASTRRRSAIEDEWHDITRFYARMLEIYVVFVNRVGDEGGLHFWGGSHVYDPWGALVEQAPNEDEALVIAELDLAAVRRRRREMPLVKEARLALLSRELERLVAE
ncbi:MAG: amidohydrolase, partial [Solirubrobacterales bacterium]|nr:amidohydrolase [Solirubrobacterales bacterium]